MIQEVCHSVHVAMLEKLEIYSHDVEQRRGVGTDIPRDALCSGNRIPSELSSGLIAPSIYKLNYKIPV